MLSFNNIQKSEWGLFRFYLSEWNDLKMVILWLMMILWLEKFLLHFQKLDLLFLNDLKFEMQIFKGFFLQNSKLFLTHPTNTRSIITKEKQVRRRRNYECKIEDYIIVGSWVNVKCMSSWGVDEHGILITQMEEEVKM